MKRRPGTSRAAIVFDEALSAGVPDGTGFVVGIEGVQCSNDLIIAGGDPVTSTA